MGFELFDGAVGGGEVVKNVVVVPEDFAHFWRSVHHCICNRWSILDRFHAGYIRKLVLRVMEKVGGGGRRRPSKAEVVLRVQS